MPARLARTRGAVVDGIGGCLVEVEAHVQQGLPAMTIVGLPDTAVSEARDRARAAVVNSGATWPMQRITVGLSPASVHKRGPSLDVAIAVAVLAATGQVPPAAVAGLALVGELALSGAVRPVRGVLAMALAARRAGVARLLVPAEGLAEARLVPDLDVVGVTSLRHLAAVLAGEEAGADPPEPADDDGPGPAPDLGEVRGQPAARAAVEVAAAGGHHLALWGPPGCGKTMLAERIPGLLPPLTPAEALEVTALRSVADRLPRPRLLTRPPFEAPHHSASPVALVGGGHGGTPRPGLVSLAHRGVLFLDEAAEFDARVLQTLRQPLESGTVTISRAGFTVRLPARFLLVLATNPCPCGRYAGTGRACTCSGGQRRRYAARLSGPLLDRVDVQLAVARPTLAELDDPGPPETTAVVAARVAAARERAARRYAGTPWTTNGEVPGAVLRQTWPAARAGESALDRALRSDRLTLRGADRVRRVAWTLADLAGRDRPGGDEVGAAQALRQQETPWAA